MYKNSFESPNGYVFNDECSYYKYMANREDYPYGPIGLGASKIADKEDTSHKYSSEYTHSTRSKPVISYEKFEVEVISCTEKARLLSDGIGEFWLPKRYVYECKGVTIACVPEWLKIKYLKDSNVNITDDFEVIDG